jgi:hypothetical protein
MRFRHFVPLVTLAAACIPGAHAATLYTIQIVADNDFAVFAGTDTSVTRLIYQNNDAWPTQISAAASLSFGLDPGETTFYLLGMGGGGDENISGTLNNVDIASIPVQMSSDLSSQLSGYNGGAVAAGTYDASLADVQAAFPSLTWGPPVVTTTDTVVVLAAPHQIGYHFDDGTAHLFTFTAEAVSGVPEPATTWLCAGSIGLILLIRRLRGVRTTRAS